MAKRKVKTVTTQLNAVWEIMEAAMYIDKLKRSVVKMDLIKIYRGNFLPCLYDERIDPRCKWKVTLTITFLNAQKEQCVDNLEWEFGTPMTFREMIMGNKNHFMYEAGFKTIWQGINHEWHNYCKKHLKDATPLSAWATATTTTQVKPVKFNHAHTHYASKLNKDFRTNDYLI